MKRSSFGKHGIIVFSDYLSRPAEFAIYLCHFDILKATCLATLKTLFHFQKSWNISVARGHPFQEAEKTISKERNIQSQKAKWGISHLFT